MICNVCGYSDHNKPAPGEEWLCPRCLEYAGDLTDFLTEKAEAWGTDLDHADPEMVEAWRDEFWAERNEATP